jgi:hypothetical protein
LTKGVGLRREERVLRGRLHFSTMLRIAAVEIPAELLQDRGRQKRQDRHSHDESIAHEDRGGILLKEAK